MALLETREVILKELKFMTKEFRSRRLPTQADESRSYTSTPYPSDDESEDRVKSDLFIDVENESVHHPISADENEEPPKVVLRDETADETSPMSGTQCPANSSSWIEFYSERFVLHVSADLLLMYARTSNFFALTPYSALESTPVEVYARELGNVVPRSVIDDGITCGTDGPPSVPICGSSETTAAECAPMESQRPVSRNLENHASLAEAKRTASDLCSPDDVVAEVTVSYQGDYVLSQLLQWYNAGIGQKPGLPDLLGCALLPSMSDCWSSELLKTSRMKGDRRTTYETKIRPKLVEWLQDPYQRGNPWPHEIRKAFVGNSSLLYSKDSSAVFMPFGSPIIDFLVTGDESNISEVLSELDADDKVVARKSADGLLSSIDKGRPAQAVSTWVQCEHPECMKWRKLPWYVDADLLERFYCEDNKWNPNSNYCGAPEDDWDTSDALVGEDGKVEGTPVKKKREEDLSVEEESSFVVGYRFDVQRSDKNHYSVATVTKVDFSGTVKRIMFHFAKTSSDRDEWIEFGSPRIAPLHSKVPKKLPKTATTASNKKTQPGTPVRKEISRSEEVSGAEAALEDSKSSKIKKEKLLKTKKEKQPKPKKEKLSRPRKDKSRGDPTDEGTFVVGTRFDVYRNDKQRFFYAVVKEVEFSAETKRILFHFPKTNDKFDEWIEFGSPRIFAYKSKVEIVRKERKPKGYKSAEKQLWQEAALISKAVLSKEQPDITSSGEPSRENAPDVSSRPPASEDLDVTESHTDDNQFAYNRVESSESDMSRPAVFVKNNTSILSTQSHHAIRRFSMDQPTQSFTSSIWQTSSDVPMYEFNQRVCDTDIARSDGFSVSGQDVAPLRPMVSMDRPGQSSELDASHSINPHGFTRGIGEFQNLRRGSLVTLPTAQRPPDFVTGPRRSSFPSLGMGSSLSLKNGFSSDLGFCNSSPSFGSIVPPPASTQGMSGLDILAAVSSVTSTAPTTLKVPQASDDCNPLHVFASSLPPHQAAFVQTQPLQVTGRDQPNGYLPYTANQHFGWQ